MSVFIKPSQLSDQYYEQYWFHVSITDCESDKDFMNMFDGCVFE